MDPMTLQWRSILGFTLMEDDPWMLNITASLATLNILISTKKVAGKHRQAPSAASKCFKQSG